MSRVSLIDLISPIHPAGRFSPTQPWARFFYPPNPPIASQSIYRDAPFSQAAMASIYLLLPSSLVLLCMEVDGRLLRLAMGAWLCRCDRVSDGETQCSMVRSEEVLDGTSLRSQAATEPCGVPIAGAPGDHPPPSAFWLCAFGEQRTNGTETMRVLLLSLGNERMDAWHATCVEARYRTC